MELINKILNHELYIENYEKIQLCEKDRELCRHNMGHFLDVARIAYIKVLEGRLNYSKELIYAIGVLHDIGRAVQYEKGTPHDITSVEISKEILIDIDFSNEEKALILKGIKNHRKKVEDELSIIIYDADKLSRSCHSCSAEKQCYWSKDKKNLFIKY